MWTIVQCWIKNLKEYVQYESIGINFKNTQSQAIFSGMLT